MKVAGHFDLGILKRRAIDVFEGVMAEMARLEKSFPPGLEWRLAFDSHWGDHAVDALRALHRACRVG